MRPIQYTICSYSRTYTKRNLFFTRVVSRQKLRVRFWRETNRNLGRRLFESWSAKRRSTKPKPSGSRSASFSATPPSMSSTIKTLLLTGKETTYFVDVKRYFQSFIQKQEKQYIPYITFITSEEEKANFMCNFVEKNLGRFISFLIGITITR